MGNCMGNSSPRLSRGSSNNRTVENSPTQRENSGGPRKNLPVRHEKLRWRSDQPLTLGQVQSKRDEFWDTAPAFEGRKEIWDALKAAVSAIENVDYSLAQAIIDGANISLPNGTLTDCYDELGTRYQLPVYCLSMPLNIVHQNNLDNIPDKVLGNGRTGEELILKVRLSTSLKDIKLKVLSDDTVASAKQKLEMQERLGLFRQRWFYGGKMLVDKLGLLECNLKPNWIVQCILTENSITPVDT